MIGVIGVLGVIGAMIGVAIAGVVTGAAAGQQVEAGAVPKALQKVVADRREEVPAPTPAPRRLRRTGVPTGVPTSVGSSPPGVAVIGPAAVSVDLLSHRVVEEGVRGELPLPGSIGPWIQN